jgi:hypothetical protein
MAFFGLTALGPQNSFSTSSTLYRHLQVFDEKDFIAAWNRVNKANAPHCHKSKIPEIMRVLFHGPIPVTDVEAIENAFKSQFETPDTISMSTFVKVMSRLREEAEAQQKQLESVIKPTCEYISSSEMHLALKKNAAMKKELQTKQTVPLTGAQDVSNIIGSAILESVYILSSIFALSKMRTLVWLESSRTI